MSWYNAGAWHIDHIVPKSMFDPTNAEDVAACWALTNLRPVWARVNMAKAAKAVYLC